MIKTFLERNNLTLLLSLMFLYITGSLFESTFISFQSDIQEGYDWINEFYQAKFLGSITGFIFAGILALKYNNAKSITLFSLIIFAISSLSVTSLYSGDESSLANALTISSFFFFSIAFLKVTILSWLLGRLHLLSSPHLLVILIFLDLISILSYSIISPLLSSSIEAVVIGSFLLIGSIIIFLIVATNSKFQFISKESSNKMLVPLSSLFVIAVIYWFLYFILQSFSQSEIIVIINDEFGSNSDKTFLAAGILLSVLWLFIISKKYPDEDQYPYIYILRLCLIVLFISLILLSEEVFTELPHILMLIVGSTLLTLKTTMLIMFMGVSSFLIVKSARPQFLIFIMGLWLALPQLIALIFYDLIDYRWSVSTSIVIKFYYVIIAATIAYQLRHKIKALIGSLNSSDYNYVPNIYQWKDTSDKGSTTKTFSSIGNILIQGSAILSTLSRLLITIILLLQLELGKVIGLFYYQSQCTNLDDAFAIVIAELILGYFLFLGLFSRFAALLLLGLCFVQTQLGWIDGLAVSGTPLENNNETLLIIGALSSFILIFGGGKLSLNNLSKDYLINSRKLIFTLFIACAYPLTILVQSDDETIAIKYYSYTNVTLNVSDASLRSYQIIHATGQIFKEIDESVLPYYLENGHKFPPQSSNLKFLNEFIEKDYPDATYRVIVNDIWQQPYMIDWSKKELRSKGPDKIINTHDDIVYVSGGEVTSHYRAGAISNWKNEGTIYQYDLEELQYQVWQQDEKYYGVIEQPITRENMTCKFNKNNE